MGSAPEPIRQPRLMWLWRCQGWGVFRLSTRQTGIIVLLMWGMDGHGSKGILRDQDHNDFVPPNHRDLEDQMQKPTTQTQTRVRNQACVRGYCRLHSVTNQILGPLSRHLGPAGFLGEILDASHFRIFIPFHPNFFVVFHPSCSSHFSSRFSSHFSSHFSWFSSHGVIGLIGAPTRL